ncbi:MAG TPA: DUF4266 domain-containing protein [Rhizomicrobium sp.]|nr:DUF4266 domain-containing protein [Rhizomicrobium sp.]
MNMPHQIARQALLACALVAAAACAACTGPRPWEKDLMARPEMQLTPYPLQTAADEHIYFSKEASSGGRGFAGGGCGCN